MLNALKRKKSSLSSNEILKSLHSLAVVSYSWEFPTDNADKEEKKADSTVTPFYVAASHKANIPT